MESLRKNFEIAKREALNVLSYEDNFALCEFFSNFSICLWNFAFASLGIERKDRQTRVLRFKVQETCNFVREEVKEMETSETSFFGLINDKVVTSVPVYVWKFSFAYDFGSFCHGEGSFEIRTGTKEAPFPEVSIRDNEDLDCGFLFKNDDGDPNFRIDRQDEKCFTPVRNGQVEELNKFRVSFENWLSRVQEYFRNHLFKAYPQDDVVILGEHESFGATDCLVRQWFLNRDLVTLDAIMEALDSRKMKINEVMSQEFPVFEQETKIDFVLSYLLDVCAKHEEGMRIFEAVLRRNVIQAIGKVVKPKDFSDYMLFHNRIHLKAPFLQKAFVFPVRRNGGFYDTEGTVSLTSHRHKDPLFTHCSKLNGKQKWRFSLSSAAEVNVNADIYLHGCIKHQFKQQDDSLDLKIRAKQFSNFLVLIGRVNQGCRFDPQHGIIVQNKDVVDVFLELETFPSAKEFRDAIESLSEEQKSFAKMYRGLQLSSTLFGVMVC